MRLREKTTVRDFGSSHSKEQEIAPTKPVVTGGPGKDQTRGWPQLPTVKQKSASVVLDKTVKKNLYCEGRKSRRSDKAAQQRHAKAVCRWEAQEHPQWMPSRKPW